MSFSGVHIFILLVVILVLFGGRKIPELGEGLGKGIRAFKKGLSGEDEEPKKLANQDAEKSSVEKQKDHLES